jgi:uncharacterized membrane protein
MLQHASRQRCCSSRRGNAVAAHVAATLLQLTSLRHCCSRRCGIVATGAAATLRQRCGAVVAALLQLAATTESNALCNDGKWL